MDVLIKKGHIVDPENNVNGIMDMHISCGKILKISKELPEKTFGKDVEVIDAEGLYVLPGFIDAHCHLREPGYEYKEDIESGTRSAAKGGFTCIACMPNTNPPADNGAVIEYIIKTADKNGVVKVIPIGAVTKGQEGEELSEIGELKKAGAAGISDDGLPVKSSSLFKKALLYASDFNIPVISHCEDKEICENGYMNEGYMSTKLGLRGVPWVTETLMAARDILIAEYLGKKVHIAHVSSKRTVDIIRDAKKRGVLVTCETCPHYFSLTEDACEGFNTYAKVNPPLKTKDDIRAVIEGITDGTIDMIATDHAPHHSDEKNIEFGKAANGIAGFETAFSVSYDYLVKPGFIDMSKLIELMVKNPAKLLGLESNGIKPGADANITIVDTDKKIKVEPGNFSSKCKGSPYDGMDLYGTVEYTIVNGEIIVMKGKGIWEK